MGRLEHITTIGTGPLGAGSVVTDLILTQTGTSAALRVLTHDPAVSMVYGISSSGAVGHGHVSGPSAAAMRVQYANREASVTAHQLARFTDTAAPHAPVNGTPVVIDNRLPVGAPPIGVEISRGPDSFLLISDPAAEEVTLFAQADGGVSRASGPLSLASSIKIAAIDMAVCSGPAGLMAFALRPGAGGLVSLSIDRAGKMKEVDDLGPEFGIGSATAMSCLQVGDRTFLLVGDAGADTLSVLAVASDGTMEVADRIIDNKAVHLGNVQVVESFSVGGHAYVVVGGGENGLSLFSVLPDGRLVHVSSVADTPNMALSQVSDLAVMQTNSGAAIFAGSGRENGLTQLAVSAAGSGALKVADDDGGALRGTGARDTLIGGRGADDISGGAGADILTDGAGSDTLRGGAGADIFIFEKDGADDTIRDFELGTDTIDLSSYRTVRDVRYLQFTSTSFGGKITIQGEELNIYTADGRRLDIDRITNSDILNVDRPFIGQFAEWITINGSSASNTLRGSDAAERIYGYGGNDRIVASTGLDVLDGGSGTDVVTFAEMSGAVSANLVDGTATVNADSVQELRNVENLIGSHQADTLRGNQGRNVLEGMGGTDTIMGGAGDDRIFGGGQGDTIRGEAGDDYIEGNSSIDNIDGGSGRDTIYGQSGRDVVDGGQDNDSIFGGAGIDRLNGGAGDDLIVGNTATDYIHGNAGNDRLYGSQGRDALYGDGGNDELRGATGADTLNGGGGDDLLLGSAGKDVLIGGNGNDRLNGGTGGDQLRGGRDHDRLFGASGADRLEGESGDDHLDGGTGTDWLDGGEGDDTLIGGDGGDTFVFRAGSDVITDFNPLYDRLQFASDFTSPSNSSQLRALFRVENGDGVLDFGGGHRLELDGITDFALLESRTEFLF